MDTPGTRSDSHIICSGSDSTCQPKDREMNPHPHLRAAAGLQGKQSSTQERGTDVGAGKRGESAKAFGELGLKVSHCPMAGTQVRQRGRNGKGGGLSRQLQCTAGLFTSPSNVNTQPRRENGKERGGRDRASQPQRRVQA